MFVLLSMFISTINPMTNQVIQTYPIMDSQTVQTTISQTHEAYIKWQSFNLEARAQCMRKLASLLRKNIHAYAQLITTEMGKPITKAQEEIEKCAWVCEHYAAHASIYLAQQSIATDMQASYVTYQPLGVILGIMPWNFPFWQVFRFAVPTLMAGNAVLLKHAAISTGAALAMEKLFQESGFPSHLFRTLLINNTAAAAVIAHPAVKGVSLTGSEQAGAAVASIAGKHLKKVVLELGGNDPYIILPDADLDQAAEVCVASRLNNSGQVCIAAKRIIVTKAIAKKFKAKILEKAKQYIMGDPQDQATQLGPLARRDLRDQLHQQITASIQQGAQCLLGGFIPADQVGNYYPVTVLDQVKPGMPAYHEELFGPVITLIHARDEADAIRIANDSDYGLGGAIFTADIAHGEQIAQEQLQVGACAINTYVITDPRLPFGGINRSGYGRELGAEGIHAFVNIKTIVVR